MFVLNNEHPFFFVVKWCSIFQLPLLYNASKKRVDLIYLHKNEHRSINNYTFAT